MGLLPFLQAHGISHYTTPPHTPEQNGVAECRHRYIVETGLALLHFAKLPLKFWSHAFQTATYLINRLPTPILDHKSPYQCLFNQSPNYTKLKPFGCLCYPWLRSYTTSKLQPRSKPCLFLGYSDSKSAYKCYDPESQKLYHSRHVEFILNEFPSVSTEPSTSLPSPDSFLTHETSPTTNIPNLPQIKTTLPNLPSNTNIPNEPPPTDPLSPIQPHSPTLPNSPIHLQSPATPTPQTPQTPQPIQPPETAPVTATRIRKPNKKIL